MSYFEKIQPYLAMDEKFHETFLGRAVLGGILGALLAICNQVSVYSILKSLIEPYSVIIKVAVLVVLALTLARRLRDKNKILSSLAGGYSRAASWLADFCSPVTSRLADWGSRKLMKTWCLDISALFLILSGVCLGTLVSNIGLNILGTDREIWPYILLTGLFFAASLVFHNCCSICRHKEANGEEERC